MKETTDFGFEEIPKEEKTARVAEVFHSVATRYDLMNDVMSVGIHRLWKRFTVSTAQARAGQKILDLAGGSGDLALKFGQLVGESGHVVLADINDSMLAEGRVRSLDAGFVRNISFAQVDAESLPFQENYFDTVTMAFGLRNVTDKNKALKSIYKVLKPGGKVLILEFSHPNIAFVKKIYDLYSFNVIPKMGQWITGDEESYQYLVESIRMHPDQETLKSMMVENGFEQSSYCNLTAGVVALHKGYKY